MHESSAPDGKRQKQSKCIAGIRQASRLQQSQVSGRRPTSRFVSTSTEAKQTLTPQLLSFSKRLHVRPRWRRSSKLPKVCARHSLTSGEVRSIIVYWSQYKSSRNTIFSPLVLARHRFLSILPNDYWKKKQKAIEPCPGFCASALREHAINVRRQVDATHLA